MVTCTCERSCSGTPEDRNHPDELVGVGEKRKSSHCDLSLDAVQPRHLHSLVRGTPLGQSDRRGAPLCRKKLTFTRSRSGLRRPLLKGHLTRFCEGRADDRLSSLVEVDETSVLIGDPHRGRQVGGELAREDQHKMLLVCHFAEP